MKKILNLVFVLLILIGLTACDYKKEQETDAVKFKKEYESLNNKKAEDDKSYREITLREDNPFIYADASEIVQMIEDKKTFIVYFGFAKCPWCRSVLETLDKVAQDSGLDTIYYVDVYDIRDTLELDKNDKIIEKSKGTDEYYKLLEALDGVLEKYELTNSKGKEIDTKEKRIYAPNVVAVVDGKPKQLETGISKKQTDAYMKLTKEMKEETYSKFKCLIDCILKEQKTCDKKTSC